MKKLDLENKKPHFLVIGKASFNTAFLGGMKKDDFIKTYSGALRGQNMEDAWKQVKPFTKVDKPKPSKKK